MTTTTTTAEITSRIQYNRDNRDYDCFVTIDEVEEYIGSASTYTAGESKCNTYAYDHYSDNHTPEVAAAIALGDVVVVGESDSGKYCGICGSLLGINRQECGIRICPDCERSNQSDVDAQFCITPIPAPELLAEVDALLSDGPRCPGTGLADCGERLPAGALFCASCTQIHHRIRWAAQFPNDQERWVAAGREWEQRSARILANVTAMLAPTCSCGAPATQHIPAGRGLVQPMCDTCSDGLLLAPVVRRVSEQAR